MINPKLIVITNKASTRMITDTAALIMYTYPYPLARSYYRAYLSTRDDNQIYDLLIDSYEVIVKYLATIAISQYLSDGATDARINEALRAIVRPGLGDWLKWLNQIIAFYQTKDTPMLMAELPVAYNKQWAEDSGMVKAYNTIALVLSERSDKDYRQAQEVSTAQFLELMMQYRNTQASGLMMLNSYDRKYIVQVIAPAIEELILSLSFLARYQLVAVNEVCRASNVGTGYEHYITNLSGNNPIVVYNSYVRANDDAQPDQVYICAANQEYEPTISLHPFLIYRFCPQCRTEQTFVLNEGNPERVSYLSYQCGDQFAPTKYNSDLKAFFDKIGM